MERLPEETTSAARNTAAVASSGAATRTSTPEAQARTAAGPTRSIAKMASETGSGVSGENLCIRIFRQSPKRAPPREPRLFAKRIKVALKTFFRAPGRVAFLAIRARSSSLIGDQYHRMMTVLRMLPRYGARKTVTYN